MAVEVEITNTVTSIKIPRKRLMDFALSQLFANLDEEVVASLLGVELEHVTEDRQAIAELYRVLRPGGWAVLLVPIRGQETHEDPAIQTPEARREAYDQEDHVRMYGRDFKDRLAEAGFSVQENAYALHFEPDDRRRYGLDESDLIYYCSKPLQN